MRNKEEGIVPAVEEKKPPRRRMTQEQIELLTRYETVHMPEEAFRRLSLRSKEVLTPADLADQGELPVPMDQIDDYIANICREINECEARFMRQRDRILNDYYTKGYAHEEEEEGEEASSPALPAPVGNRNPHPNPPPSAAGSGSSGRRRFRPGVTKSKHAAKANKMVRLAA